MKWWVVFFVVLFCAGCLLDSVEPWLSPETIVETTIELDGAWTVLDEVENYGGAAETFVTLTHKPATSRAKEFFYIEIRPKKRNTQFIFQATVHEIEGLRFLQISNFTHFDDRIFGLANRPTYSLWRVEADADNIIMWMPDLDRSSVRLKTLRDQDDKVLFVDSASNNELAIRDWVRAYRLADERPRKVLPVALTRTGTEFVMPTSALPHMPAEFAKRERSRDNRKTPAESLSSGKLE
jgi:hypothetical protein